MHGFVAFGKTTTAKKIAAEHKAVRLTSDEFNVRLFGRNPAKDGFKMYHARIKEIMWDIAAQSVANGIDVVFDTGLWGKEHRTNAVRRAKEITPNVVLHVVRCDIATARNRAVARTAAHPEMLEINADDFDECLPRFEPPTDKELKNYKVEIVIYENGRAAYASPTG